MNLLKFLNLGNPPSRTVAQDLLSQQQKLVSENTCSSKAPPARMVDNLTAICEPIV
jgi:hypothetical protein